MYHTKISNCCGLGDFQHQSLKTGTKIKTRLFEIKSKTGNCLSRNLSPEHLHKTRKPCDAAVSHFDAMFGNAHRSIIYNVTVYISVNTVLNY